MIKTPATAGSENGHNVIATPTQYMIMSQTSKAQPKANQIFCKNFFMMQRTPDFEIEIKKF